MIQFYICITRIVFRWTY